MSFTDVGSHRSSTMRPGSDVSQSRSPHDHGVRTITGDVIDIPVVDDGPGIGGIDSAELFAPGFHAPDSPGSGLGLSLACRLARAAGGDFDVRAIMPAKTSRIARKQGQIVTARAAPK
jgi:nitrogen-specific signal transduction histidine kinase